MVIKEGDVVLFFFAFLSASIAYLWLNDSANMLFRYIIVGVCGILGLWAIFVNWILVLKNYIQNYRSSKIPFLGGLFLCIALSLIPNNPFDWWLYLLVLMIDIGCLPLLIGTVVYIFWRKYKKL